MIKKIKHKQAQFARVDRCIRFINQVDDYFIISGGVAALRQRSPTSQMLGTLRV